MTKFHVLTLFPEMIEQGLSCGVIGRAVRHHIISLNPVNIRDYTLEKHGKVDDYPYGGGAGMLIQAQPVYDAHKAITGGRRVRTVYVTPQGRPFDQKLARELAAEEELILLCGHYEGIDERVLEEIVTDDVSIGDYILTGGELAAMVIIDAVARLCPGVLGNDSSASEESFHNDLLEYPQYTRPEVWQDKSVPEVLLSGNHTEVTKWRLAQSIERTGQRRPDLYEKYLQKQQLAERLAGDKRNNIHLTESLLRGRGEIMCALGEDAAIYDRSSGVCMLRASTPEAGARLLESCPEGVGRYLAEGEHVVKLLQERGFDRICECSQYLYTQREPLPVRHKEIRRLGEESLAYICSRYPAVSQKYGRERLLAGAVYGAFLERQLVGFAGIHGIGSVGMLFVEEAFRGRGIGAFLESFCINRLLESGCVPFVHVPSGHKAAEHLQDKLGLYPAGNHVYWIGKEGRTVPYSVRRCKL